MKSKWWMWSMAVALCLATIAASAPAQPPPARGSGEIGARPVEGAGDPGRLDDAEAFDGLDLLLAADLPPGPGPGGRMGPGMGRGMGRGGRGPGELREKLNLTDDQKSKLADIHDRQAHAAIPIEADLRIASLDLRKLMRADKPDSRAIDAQIDRIASLRASLQKRHVAGMLEARMVLTPAQQKLMREQGGGMMGRGMRGGRGMRMRHM